MRDDEPTRTASEEGLADFASFYAAHAQDVLVYLAGRCADAEVAVDLMAETFAQAPEHQAAFRGQTPEEATSWVFGIARNLLANYYRRGRAEHRAVRRLGIQIPPLASDDYSRIEELADLASVRHAIQQDLEGLSAEQREAVQLRVVQGVPYSEIARRLSVSEPAARARVSRGIQRLSASLGRRPVAEGVLGLER